MFKNRKIVLMLCFAVTLVLNIIALKFYLSLKYISIDKVFSPLVFKGEKSDLQYKCRIDLNSKRKWYDQASISVITGSEPYELFLALSSKKVVDVEVKNITFACDNVSYTCKNLKFKKKFNSSLQTFYFTIDKIFIPFVENKKLKVTYNLSIKDSNGNTKNETISAFFTPIINIETGFKFVEEMKGI
ncbi:hypothetical protein AAEX28_01585 [Lentisphaerota bacterium WC36G]|nr:hypothetical protein LJT99_04470 [Lentisphaerae bacterium WC36]